MKKIIILFFMMISMAIVSNAQNAFQQNDKLLGVGLGLNSYYNGGSPVGVSYEIGVTDNISVGGSFDYISKTYEYAGAADTKFSTFYLAARASYHLNRLIQLNTDNVDLYGGAALGYRSFTWSNPYFGSALDNNYNSGLYLGLYVGGKYYFSHSVGVFLEVGAVGSTNARVGLGFKL